MSDGKMYVGILFVLVFVGLYVAGATYMFQGLLWYACGWDWPLWIDITAGFIITAISLYLGIDLIVIVFDE
jgi:hypothetical protein